MFKTTLADIKHQLEARISEEFVGRPQTGRNKLEIVRAVRTLLVQALGPAEPIPPVSIVSSDEELKMGIVRIQVGESDEQEGYDPPPCRPRSP